MSRRSAWAAAAVVFAVTLFLSIRPIRSYDFFWHLASGRWIVENGAIPQQDPFGVASDPVAWIDGEWLFQTAAWSLWSAGGTVGIIIVRALLVALLFGGLAFVTVIRAGPHSAAAAAAIALIAFTGAEHRLTDRPETIATMLMVAFILVARHPRSTRSLALAAAIVAIWINVHPSALLAPVVVALFMIGDWLSGELEEKLRRVALLVVSAAALLVSPYGVNGVVAPLRLASAAAGGTFVNLEWTASRITDFPLLYAAVAASGLAFARWGGRRRLGELMVFVLFSFLAFRFVRNQGFLFATLPLLVPLSTPLSAIGRRASYALAAVTLLIVVGIPAHRQMPSLGVSELFPRCAASRVSELGLQGTIYNPDQWGGFLIWRFYPERRVLTDGRNELYSTYLAEFEAARLDGRRWTALLNRYRVTLAIDEYRPPFVGAVDGVTGRPVSITPSKAYWPRREWALVAFDDRAMVFARRSAHPADVIARAEYRFISPEEPDRPQADGTWTRHDVMREIERAKRECGDGERLRAIARANR